MVAYVDKQGGVGLQVHDWVVHEAGKIMNSMSAFRLTKGLGYLSPDVGDLFGTCILPERI